MTSKDLMTMRNLCIPKALLKRQARPRTVLFRSARCHSFLLVEVLVAISLIACVAISIFSIEKRLSQAMQNAHNALERSMARSRAITLLIEELSQKKIPLDTLISNKPIHYDLSYHDWSADYLFSINKKAPAASPSVFQITAIITLQHPATKVAKDMESSFTFTVSRNIRDGGNT